MVRFELPALASWCSRERYGWRGGTVVSARAIVSERLVCTTGSLVCIAEGLVCVEEGLLVVCTVDGPACFEASPARLEEVLACVKEGEEFGCKVVTAGGPGKTVLGGVETAGSEIGGGDSVGGALTRAGVVGDGAEDAVGGVGGGGEVSGPARGVAVVGRLGPLGGIVGCGADEGYWSGGCDPYTAQKTDLTVCFGQWRMIFFTN